LADLNTLQPSLIPWARWIYNFGKYYDGRLVVTSARRSSADQRRLYQKYIRGESEIPAAHPGTSMHEIGWAFDLARIGKSPVGDDFLMWLGSWWEYYGGKHGGSRDPVHFQTRV